jgi:uroporphyrinogen decarboxylase
MKSKERVKKALDYQVTDRPPIFATLTPQVAKRMSEYKGFSYEPPLDSLLSTRISHMSLLTALGNDCVGIAACAPKSRPTFTAENGVITNEWGMKFKNAGLYNEFCHFPLENAESAKDISNYSFFDPNDESRFDEARKAIEKYSEDFFIVADLECAIFETAWYLVGLEKFLIDLMIETPYVDALLDKIMEINTVTGKKLIALGADMIWAGDDFGTQESMIMDPDLWRKYFKPRMKLMFDEFRKTNPTIKIAWHTCGSVLPIIPDLIEIGLDVLNPIQPLAKDMNPDFLKKTYGKDLAFFGGIDVQYLLPKSTPLEIKTEVTRITKILGDGGGYIIAPAHNIQDDTPTENILALFEAVKEIHN